MCASTAIPVHVLARHAQITAQLPQGSINQPFLEILGRSRRRRWMSVADLIANVEEAMVRGFRLHKDGRTYADLQREAERLRAENDELTNEIDEIKVVRQRHVAEMKIQEDEIIAVTKQIQEIDFQLAELRNKHLHNIKDVGYLKIAMTHIEKSGEVLALVDKIEECLDSGDILTEDGHLYQALTHMLEDLQNEYNKVSPKIAAYGHARGKLAAELLALERDTGNNGESPQDVDNRLQEITAKLLQDRRMTAQLYRLCQLQVVDSELIGRLERSKATLLCYAEINRLRTARDPVQINAKVEQLNGDLERLRTSIQHIESRLGAHAQKGEETIASLRSMGHSLTSAMGKRREELFGNIRQEGQWKTRLAILRGQKLQTFRFIGLLKAALPK